LVEINLLIKMVIKYVTKKGKMFWPSDAMKKIANMSDVKIYAKAEKNPVKFWGELAKTGLTWEKEWLPKNTYVENLPYFQWFKGGKINFSVNCIDRHLDNGNKTALIWVPEPTNEKPIKITYAELYDKVNRFANVLKS